MELYIIFIDKYIFMSKKVKRLKVTEEMMNEIINADGGIIRGGEIEYPASSRIKTTTYSNKKNGMAWHTDNQKWATTQDSKFYHYLRGYGFSSGNMSESYIIEDDLKEDILSDKFDNSDLINKDETTIPDFEELSKSYDMPDITDNVENLIDNIKSFSSDEKKYEDIIAIVVKYIIKELNTKELRQQQRKELKDSI